MEKGRSRVGIKQLKTFNKTQLLNVQEYWGHHKKRLDVSASKLLLGLRNDFCVTSPEFSKEYSNHIKNFCYLLILASGNITFFNPKNDQQEELRKVIYYFGRRCLQPVQHFWIIGNLTNKQLNQKRADAIIVPLVDKHLFVLKEALQNLTPLIAIKDTNVTVDKLTYPFLSNDDSINVYYNFYNLLSNTILKAYLYKHILRT